MGENCQDMTVVYVIYVRKYRTVKIRIYLSISASSEIIPSDSSECVCMNLCTLVPKHSIDIGIM